MSYKSAFIVRNKFSLTFVLSQCIVYWINSQNIYTFTYQKTLLHSTGFELTTIWLNGRVFVYELSSCGFESRCSHLNFRYRACFNQGVPWHSGNYSVWVHSEKHTWNDKNNYSQLLHTLSLLLFEIVESLKRNI